MITKYKTLSFETRIDKVEVEKETDKSVWVDGRSFRKLSGYECYFDTFEEAKSYYLERAGSKVISAKKQLEFANREFDESMSLVNDG